MFCIYSLVFYRYLYFALLCFFVIILLICIFVNLLHVFRNIADLFYFLFSRSVSVNVNFDKDITHTVHLQSNTPSLELWIIFQVIFLPLLVCCKHKSDKKLKYFLPYLKCMTLLFFINKSSSDFINDVELVPDQNFLRLSSLISVVISNFRLLE